MADDERPDVDETESSLELPRLGSLLRRHRARRPDPPPSAESSCDDSMEVAHAESSYDDSAEGETAVPRRRREKRPRKPLRVRWRVRVPGAVGAVLAGLVVGVALVGLTAGGLRVCSALRGTPSCGNPGILLLLAITVAAILLGTLVLRLSGVATSGSTSLLGVGLLVVLVLLALLPVIDDWWVGLVVPVLAMLTFAVAWWLTTTYVEPGERAR